MQITVVIATHNRPALLREAIASIEAQSFREWEIVVVDDGSQPPVDLESLSETDVERIRLLRHEVPHGPSGARNTGMRAATGNLVTFLDDDDLFKPDALKRIDSAFQNEAGLDCLFFNVELFGARAEGTRDNQDQALSQLFYKMDLPLPENDGSIVQLDSEALFIALLDHLPMAFQRVVIKRNMLEKVGLYRGRGFEDLEWYYRVVLHCQCAFQAEPLYLVRCEGQSYFSRIEAKKRLVETIIRIRESLLSLEEVSARSKLHRLVGASLAKANFNKAYFAHESGQSFPWRNFFDSCEKGFYWRHFSLVGKVLISRIRQVLSPFRQ
jgi:glycosyltransferase involved in cell wall biosynthesis